MERFLIRKKRKGEKVPIKELEIEHRNHIMNNTLCVFNIFVNPFSKKKEKELQRKKSNIQCNFIDFKDINDALRFIIEESHPDGVCSCVKFQPNGKLRCLLKKRISSTPSPMKHLFLGEYASLTSRYKPTNVILKGSFSHLQLWKSESTTLKIFLKTYIKHPQAAIYEVWAYVRLSAVLPDSIPQLLGAWVGNDKKIQLAFENVGTDFQQILSRYQSLYKRSVPAIIIAFLWTKAMIQLSKFHRLGLIHGDVKPENFVLCPNGHVKIIDLSTVVGSQGSWALRRNRHGLPHGGSLYYLDPLTLKFQNKWPSAWLLGLDLYAAGKMLESMAYNDTNSLELFRGLVDSMTREDPIQRLSVEDAIKFMDTILLKANIYFSQKDFSVIDDLLQLI